jgi:hypothetical protein
MDIRHIDTFGKVAAEDDAILEYFLATETTKSIELGNHLLVIGEKGSGKTALVRYFSERTPPGLICRAVRMTDYPWGVHAQRRDAGAGETDVYTAAWLYLLAVEYAKLISSSCRNEEDEELERIRAFLKANYGNENANSSEILRPDALKLSGTLEPQLFGTKLGRLEFTRRSNDTRLGAELHTVSEALFVNAETAAQKYLGQNRVLLHIDELDHGLSVLDESRANMLTGLILAARAVFRRFEQHSAKYFPIVYLRTDLWDALQFSDKNKIRQTYTREITWTEEDLKRLIEERARKKLNVPVKFENMEDGATMRGSQRKWSHIVARTKRRPRDVIQFMNAVLYSVKLRVLGNGEISNKDVTGAREQYSSYFKGELNDEILPHWPEWETAMGAIASLARLAFSFSDFETAYSVRQHTGQPSAREALERLFSFSVVGYRQSLGGGGSRWVFKYLETISQFDPGATLFKVHLGLKECYRLREERLPQDTGWGDDLSLAGLYEDEDDPSGAG